MQFSKIKYVQELLIKRFTYYLVSQFDRVLLFIILLIGIYGSLNGWIK